MSEAVAFPLPSPTPLTEPFWSGIADGELRFMRCGLCGEAFLPAREECPACLSENVGWEAASGRGTLVSWVVYHRAMHPAFKDRIPYVVGIVELEEGARLISNIVGKAPDQLEIDQPLALKIETMEGAALPLFEG